MVGYEIDAFVCEGHRRVVTSVGAVRKRRKFKNVNLSEKGERACGGTICVGML